ncbi:TonB-dependent siderophore receptor [Archangium violaceum]|uniref:TonB-dependent siderophore receptor n=1 Tax=Archangium violaceum TaxID=83451 RepID=UPI002B2E7AC5|nr:TonB-dependent siderophore receptor [Archangium violaceum]
MSPPISDRRGRRFTLQGTLAGVSLLALATTAVAQEQEQGTPLTLDTVHVESERESATGPVGGYVARQSASGTKTDTSLIETPQAVSVVGQEQMEAQQAQTIVEATRYTPGVRSESFGADSRNDWFLMRGFPSQEAGYYLDGLQLFSSSFSTWRLEPFGLERIEAVRGPSSVLYGGTNPGGLLNLVSKRPPSERLLHVEAGINEYLNGYGGIDLGGPIGQSGQWFYRVTGLARGGNTQVRYIDNNRLFIAPSVTWKPSASTSLTLHGSYLVDRTRGQNFLPFVGTVVDAPYGRIPTDLFTSEPDLDRFKRDQALLGYEFEHRFNDTWTVRQNLRYGHLAINFQNLYGVGYEGSPENARLARGNFVTTPLANLVTVDNQAQVRFDTGPLHHTVLFGLDYKHYALDDEQGYEAGASLNLLNPVYGPATPTESRYTLNAVRQNQLGVYLQDQLRIAERLNLVLSGRQDWVGIRLDNELFPTSSYDGREQAFSGRAGLIYTFDNGLAPYVSYARSFNPVAGTNAAGELFEPERGQQLEAGIKFQPDEMKTTLNLSVFELRRENFLTTDGAFNQLQIGEVRSRGLELEANASLMQGLDLIGSASLYQLEIIEGADFEVGKVPVGVPQLLASLWLDYTFQNGLLKGLGAGVGGRHVGASFADRENALEVPGFTLVDAGVHYEKGPWRAALNASNVLDDTYVSSCSSAAACFYGDRRRATFKVGYTW